MSFSLSMLKQMRAEGLDFDAAIRVLEADEPKIDTAAEKRRAWDRERKREKRQSGGMSGGNPPDVGFNERDNLTSREEIPQEAKASLPQPKKTRPSSRLPEDWEPKPLIGKAAAMVACWQAGELERELAKFKNYWLAKGGAGAVSTNWQRNWVNWLINADERKPRHGRTNGLGRHQPDDGLSTTTRAARDVFGLSIGH